MTQLLFFLFFTKTVFAQVSTERILEQPLEPHPIIELKNWDVFNGETSLEDALNFQNNTGWQSWTLNTKWWDPDPTVTNQMKANIMNTIILLLTLMEIY